MGSENLAKIFKGALIAGAGAVLTVLAEKIPQVDFGAWTPFVGAGFAVIVNMIRKWIESQRGA